MTGLPFVYAAVGRARRRARRRRRRAAAAEPGRRAWRTAREIARAWAEAHGGAPALYERYLTDNIRYRLGAEELSGAGARSSTACAPPARVDAGRAHALLRRRRAERRSAAPRPPPLPEAARDAGARSRAIDACWPTPPPGVRLSPEDAIRVYERGARRWSSAPPPTRAGGRCTPTASSRTSSTATSTTPTSASPAASSATSTGRPTSKRGLHAVARGAGAEVPGDRRPRRRADPAAGRAQPRPAAHLVRGSVPLDEGQLPAGDPRPVARGDPLHRRAREHADPRGDRAADRRRASTRSRAAAPRSSTTRSATRSRRSSARPTPGWR